MPYTTYIPIQPLNIDWNGGYSILRNLGAATGKYIYLNSSSVLEWNTPNAVGGVVQLDNTGKIPTALLSTQYLPLAGNHPSTSPMTGALYMGTNTISGVSSLLVNTISNNSTNTAINLTNAINFNDATASNRRITNADRVDVTTISSIDGTTAMTIGTGTARVIINDSRVGIQFPQHYHPTSATVYSDTTSAIGAPSSTVSCTTGTFDWAGSYGSVQFSSASGCLLNFENNPISLSSYNVSLPLITSGSGTSLVISSGRVYISSSNRKYKENIEALNIDTTKIYQLQPKVYNFKGQDAVKEKTIGYIADEFAPLFPLLTNYDSNDEPNSINYANMCVVLVEELKKLRSELDDVKLRLSNANI